MTAQPYVERAAPLAAHLASFGERTALLGNGAPAGGLTYAALADRVAGFAERLGPARRLALVEGGNDVESLVAYLGAHAAGCVVMLTGGGPSRAALAAAYDPDLLVTRGDVEIVREEAAAALHPDLALLLSTSGTTGSPKLVRLSQRNLLSNARAIADYLGIRPDDVAATTLPLHYCYGLSVVHSHLLVGASLMLTDASVSEPAFRDDVRRHGVTSFAGVPHTFDLLDRSGFAELDLPSLRYLTQAGGRMAPETVRRFAELGRERGFDLVVMYGATEATARMAWLPPLLAAEAPETIGIPIPGGSFTIEPLPERPLAGPDEPEVGELVYRGDNVMLGYATSPADLALGRTVHELRTGDVGRQRDDGLFEIVGRRSRFAKVFGLRVDLDRVESVLLSRGYAAAAADGGDTVVLAVASGAAPVSVDEVQRVVHDEFGLPPAGIRLVTPASIPRLPSGKTDYRALVATTPGDEQARPAHTKVEDVVRLVARLLGRPDATAADTFVGLGGDSLSYVEASLRLERMLGALPADWPSRPLGSLAPCGQRARRSRSIETSVVLRALAIVGIVGSHANLFTVLGGAHVLLGVLGFNFGRFHAPLTGADRITKVARSVVRVAAPSVLVIGLSSLWTDGLGWKQVLLLNGWLGPESWAEPAWHYWFVEAALALMTGATLVLAVPALDRLDHRAPFWFPVGLVAVGLVPRWTRWDLFFHDGDFIHRAHAVFWIFAIGWAAARATSTRHRLVLTALVATSVPGFFRDDPVRDLVVIVGLLVLVWAARIRVPELVARVIGVLAAASLWIYLVHWQVYPHLEDGFPLAATVLSLVAGIAAWRAWERSALGRLI